MIFLQILLLVVGFVLLIKGADYFVDGASSIASNLKVPKTLIGLTIIAFGTSAPELAVSIKALSSGSGDMVLGNVFGSNILNILLILGVSALIKPLAVHSNAVKKEIPICILLTTLLVTLCLDTQLQSGAENMISRGDGITILLFFCVFLYYLISTALQAKDKKQVEKPKWKLLPSFLFTGLGLGGIIFGSNLVVDNAEAIATSMGVSQRIIALTVIALGTSLPELVTSIVSARKGETELLMGNILGSNIFNICVVLGLPVAIFGGVSAQNFSSVDIAGILVSAFALFLFASTKHKLSKAEGALMLGLFAIYYTFVFIA